MGEHEILPHCVEKWKSVDTHLTESPHFRTVVEKGEEQILTLNKAHAQTMEDIKDIKLSLVKLERSFADRINNLQMWIMSSAIAGLLVVIGGLLYFGGQMRQLEINTKDIHELKDVIRPKSITFTTR